MAGFDATGEGVGALKDFKDLRVWEEAHGLVLDAYRATAGFPKAELYGLTGQVRRAAASIPANIAEGCGRGGEAEFARFLQIAMGSASELKYHLLLARDLRFLAEGDYEPLLERLTRTKRMLNSLIQAVRSGSGARGPAESP